MTMDFGTWSGVEHEHTIMTHGINVSNTNAGAILRALELPVEYEGEVELAVFKARLARAESEWAPGDEGRPWSEDAGEGRATFIDCGRHPGYLNERFEQLRQMVVIGEDLGHRYVVWF